MRVDVPELLPSESLQAGERLEPGIPRLPIRLEPSGLTSQGRLVVQGNARNKLGNGQTPLAAFQPVGGSIRKREAPQMAHELLRGALENVSFSICSKGRNGS